MSGTRDLSLPQYLWKAQRPPPAVGEGDPDGPDTPVLPRPLWVSSTTATPPKPFTVRTASATKTESRRSGLVNKAFSYKRPLFLAQKALFLCHLCNLSRPSIQKSSHGQWSLNGRETKVDICEEAILAGSAPFLSGVSNLVLVHIKISVWNWLAKPEGNSTWPPEVWLMHSKTSGPTRFLCLIRDWQASFTSDEYIQPMSS